MDIILVRGDTYAFKFQRLDANGDVIVSVPQKMYFTVKKSFTSNMPVFQKSVDDMNEDQDGTWHVVVQPKDTEKLSYGTYAYDIEVTTGEYVQTIAKGQFRLTEEATWEQNK